jgi:cyclase
MAGSAFTKGLHDFGTGCFGYLQPDGGWGLSNAGLVVDGGEALLVDTLMDLNLTREQVGRRGDHPALKIARR